MIWLGILRNRFNALRGSGIGLAEGLLFYLTTVVVVGYIVPPLAPLQVMVGLYILTTFTLFLMVASVWTKAKQEGVLLAIRLNQDSFGPLVVIYYIVYMVRVVVPLLLLNLGLWWLVGTTGTMIRYMTGMAILSAVTVALMFMVQAMVVTAKSASRGFALFFSLPILLPWYILLLGWAEAWGGNFLFIGGLFMVFVPCTLWGTSWALKQVYT